MPSIGSPNSTSVAQHEEAVTSLHYYMPNVRLLLRRQNFSLKETMKATNTNINVPHQSTTIDERRSEISIYGQLDNILEARSVLHEEALMKYAFPITFQPDTYDQQVEQLEKDYDVQIEYLPRHGYNKFLVLIKSIQKDWKKLQEATDKLLEIFLGEEKAKDMTVNTMIELPVGCHKILTGDVDFIDKVEKKTHTRITFPALDKDSARNLQIKLGGSIKGTYSARELLLSKLPIKMCINFPSTSDDTKIKEHVEELKLKYSISVEVNTIMGNCCISFKGTEENATKLFEVSREILDFLELTRKISTRENSPILQKPASIENSLNEDPWGYNNTIKRTYFHDLILSKVQDINQKAAQNVSRFNELKALYDKNSDTVTKLFNRNSKTLSDPVNSFSSTVLPDLLISTSAGIQQNALNIQLEPLCSLVEAFLEQMGLEHYCPLFEKYNINMDRLCQMTEYDLERIGVYASGARRVILQNLDIVSQ